MKRYEHWCSLDGGGMGEPEETADGEWVRYEDAVAAVAAERERAHNAGFVEASRLHGAEIARLRGEVAELRPRWADGGDAMAGALAGM